MITIGLAGHIDHGKSSLVKRLTGTDPDRLPEERERGMTIDLGFAAWSSTGNSVGDSVPDVSFVDVPGHERFVRNMIAGAGGIEAILLVVAADDGWMPQSQEHFDIVRLLGIPEGIIAITKTDLVETDWLETVIDDVRAKTKGSFLESAPIVALSSETGAGFDELAKQLRALTERQSDSSDIGKPRLFADRAFVLSGMGGVLTGSVRGGSLSIGEEVCVYPSGAVGKIRTLHRHDHQVDRVSVGQRAALSFTGIDRKFLTRGSVVCQPELSEKVGDNKFLIARISTLPDCPVKISSRRKLLFFLGSSEIACELRTLDKEPIAPGSACLAVLRCKSEPLAFVGDRFILRLPTPQITIGGGIVLGWSEKAPTEAEIEMYSAAFVDNTSEISLDALIRLELTRKPFDDKRKIALRSNFSRAEIDKALSALIASGEVSELDGKAYLVSQIGRLISSLSRSLERKFSNEPHLTGVGVDEISRIIRIEQRRSNLDTGALLSIAVSGGFLTHTGGKYSLPGSEISVSGATKKEADRILVELKAAPFSPPLIAKLVAPGKTAREALGFLFNSNQAVKVSSELALSESAWRTALQIICDRLSEGGELTVAWLRTEIDASRKYALPILEETDRRGVTRREGDVRVKGAKFEQTVSELSGSGA